MSLQRTESSPRIAYRTFGHRGPRVLFIMGFGMPGSVWTPQVEELKADHQCCYYDHLGVGESDRGPLFRTIPGMADDAVRVLDELQWDRAHVVGVSMGGMIAQELGLRFADRIHSLTLIATHGGAAIASWPTPKGIWLFLKGLFGGRRARMRSLPRLLYTREFLDSIDSDLLRQHMGARLGKPPAFHTVLGQLAAVLRHSTESRLWQLGAPTLLVRPGQDILIRPSQTDRLAERIPGARVLRFDDAGHGVTFQKAAELNAALRDHFERVQSKPRRTDPGVRLTS